MRRVSRPMGVFDDACSKERARAVRLAEEMIASSPSGMRSFDNADRCEGYRSALREFKRRLEEEER